MKINEKKWNELKINENLNIADHLQYHLACFLQCYWSHSEQLFVWWRVEILVFLLVIISFWLCLPVYHNLMCLSSKMNSIPLHIWRFLELMSRQVILSVYFCLYLMLTYVGVIYAITVCGHSLVHISIWYCSLWGVVLLSCFWCFNEIQWRWKMQWRWKKLWETLKIKIKRKPLKPSYGSATIAVHPLSVCVSRGWFGFPHAGEMSFYVALTAYYAYWSPTF